MGSGDRVQEGCVFFGGRDSELLAYMLANLSADRPTYGLLMNGADFLFVKLVKREKAQYAFSRKFYLFNPGNDLYSVLSILKRLGQLNVGNTV